MNKSITPVALAAALSCLALTAAQAQQASDQKAEPSKLETVVVNASADAMPPRTA